MDNKEYLSVTEINSYIKTYLENNYFLRDVYVKGEISNFKRHQSGTLYFSIKDATSRINVVMFTAFANKIAMPLKDGSLVLIKGRLSVYEAGGSYQIQAYEILFDSIGLLYQEYERLKKSLEAEGLFSEEHKKELPHYPQKIGIITAPYGAAIHDMVNTINQRWPIAQVILFPSLVQGKNAAENIAEQIKVADSYHLDVIICGRGGGSIEDLWPFNEEIVARAIYQCETPIISAVGHQSDFTIADFVADIRGLTPTDGAIKATPKLEIELDRVKQLKNILFQSINSIYKLKKEQLYHQKEAYVFKHPEKIYEVYRLKLDHLETRIHDILKTTFEKKQNEIIDYQQKVQLSFKNYYEMQQRKWSLAISKLDALSPLKVLKRGYGMILKENKTIHSISQLKVNDQITMRLYDGIIYSQIVKIKEDKNGK